MVRYTLLLEALTARFKGSSLEAIESHPGKAVRERIMQQRIWPLLLKLRARQAADEQQGGTRQGAAQAALLVGPPRRRGRPPKGAARGGSA